MQTVDTAPKQPKRKRSVALTVILIIVAVLVLAAIGICWIIYQGAPAYISSQEATVASWLETSPPGKSCEQIGEDFMTAMKEGSYQTGYDLMELSLQSKIGTVSDLQDMIQEQNAQPREWSFTSWSSKTDAYQNLITRGEGRVTFQDGRQGAVTLELLPQATDCKILGFYFTW